MTTAEKKTAEVPAYLANFSCNIRDQRFSLVDTDMVLLLSLTRGYYRQDSAISNTAGGWVTHCGLYVTIEPASADKAREKYHAVPMIRFSNWLSSIDDILGTVNLTVNQHGMRLMLPNGEIDCIDIKDRERLLAFLGELRGVQLKYVANLFGFLRKDGSDKEIVTELRFPAETCAPAY